MLTLEDHRPAFRSLDVKPDRALRELRVARRPPPPPCPALPQHLTGNFRERTIMARVQRGGRRYQNNFSLRQHGTWEAAAEAATIWLRGLLAKLPLIVRGGGGPGKRNRSGVVGVHYHPGRHRLHSGRVAEYPAYVARWPGSQAGVSWMFSTHQGEETAFLLACLCRELATTDRMVVVRALSELGDERRAALLARRRAIPTAPPEPVEPASTMTDIAA